MTSVGTAPWLTQRRVIRAPINPLDTSTIVSIYPKKITEVKPTIQPGKFVIEPGTFDKPSLLIVGPSSWWKELDDEQPMLEIPTSSIQIADSIIRDYCNGLLACDMSALMPGLFFIPGAHTIEKIRKDYSEEFDKAQANQRRWYSELIQMGDILWARSNGNPLTISDDMRLAAQELRLEKVWMQDFTTMQMVQCKFCGTLVRPGFPVCATCHHVVDADMYAKMNPVIVKG